MHLGKVEIKSIINASTPTLLFIIIIYNCGCNKSEVPKKSEKYIEYPVKWYESTGDNLFLINNGQEIPVNLDIESNESAVLAWKALRYEILYPNAESGIVFYGKFTNSRSFMLDSWWIKTRN